MKGGAIGIDSSTMAGPQVGGPQISACLPLSAFLSFSATVANPFQPSPLTLLGGSWQPLRGS